MNTLLGIAVASLVVLTALSLAILLGLRMHNTAAARRLSAVEARWEPRILRLLTGEVTAADLVPDVRPNEERDVVEIAVRFAMRLTGEDRATVVGFATLFLPSILPDLGARLPEKRARALRTISVLAFDEYEPRIVAALDDPSPLVGMVAARALAGEAGPAHIAGIIGQLHRFSVWNPAFLASMVASCGPLASGDLRVFLCDASNDAASRSVVADGLRLLRDPAAADIAAGILVADPDRELTAACLRLLASVGSKDHLDAVQPMLRSDDFVLRAHAATAVGALSDGENVDGLIALIDDESTWVALHAARAIAAATRCDVLDAIVRGGGPTAAVAHEVLEETAA